MSSMSALALPRSATRLRCHQRERNGEAGGWAHCGDQPTWLYGWLRRAHQFVAQKVDGILYRRHREHHAAESGGAARRIRLRSSHELEHDLSHPKERLTHRHAIAFGVARSPEREAKEALDRARRTLDVGRQDHEV